MALLRGKLFAGALFAGLLFGAGQETTAASSSSGGAGGMGGMGYQVVTHRDVKFARGVRIAQLERERIKAQNELILKIVTTVVTSRMLE